MTETRIAQARTETVRKELTENAENCRIRAVAIEEAIRDLGGLPDMVGAVPRPSRHHGEDRRRTGATLRRSTVVGPLARTSPAHAPMEDLAVDGRFGELVRQFVEFDRIVAMLCHAPAALLSSFESGGRWLFEGYKLTAFTNLEEVQAGLADKAPWLLQDRLQEAGALFSSGDVWEPHVMVDRCLYTGQNPASSRPLADRVVADIASRDGNRSP